MSQKENVTSIHCGRVYEPILPKQLEPYQQPIVLAEVEVENRGIEHLCVQLKFSEFISFEIIGVASKLNLIYRLVRQEVNANSIEILQEWPFGIQSLEAIEIDNVVTSQPTVLNYCDCVDTSYWCRYIYRLEITQIETHQVKMYDLTNKSFLATVLQEYHCKKGLMPYIKQAHIYNPVLPICLTQKNQPIILAEAPIYSMMHQRMCIFVNFSGFVTSSLREQRFNNLKFRLVRVNHEGFEWILNEWAFRRVFVSDTLIKEPVVYNYCECVSTQENCGWVYRLELVEADLSDQSFYEITQKSMTVQVYPGQILEKVYDCTQYSRETASSTMKMVCGKVCKCVVESDALIDNQPIELAKVNVHLRDRKDTHILINYSQNFSFTLDGFNPNLIMDYQLIRFSKVTNECVVLECWRYQVAEVVGTQVNPITSIEPLILNYCDCTEYCMEEEFIYSVQLVTSLTKDTQFTIVPKEIVSIIH